MTDTNPVPEKGSFILLSKLLPYMRPMAGREALGVLCILLHSYFIILVPSFVKQVVNGLESHNFGSAADAAAGAITKAELLRNCLWILGAAALGALTLFLARWLIIGASRNIERNLRGDFLRHIQTLSPRFYHQTKTGDLMTRFASDIEQVRMLIGPGVMYPVTTLFTTSLALYSMAILNVKLTLMLLAPIAVLLIFVNIVTRFLHRYYRQAQEVYSNLSAMVQENFSGIRVIKAYCQEDAEIARFRELNNQYMDRNLAQIRLRGKLFPFMQFIGGTGIILILWLGGVQVIQGTLGLGELVQFSLYYQMLMWPIIALGWIINVIHRGMASWRRLLSIMETEPEIPVTRAKVPSELLRGRIEFRNLTFAYGENAPPVLKNVSFAIEPGETLAIVGPTGSGKTTVINLLLRLYPAPPGTIYIDGRDINDIPLEVLRGSIAYVSQDVFLFSETIRSNIMFGLLRDEQAEERTIVEAASRAQLANEVEEFPHGYDTEIGERGITLSGGQKQRTGIARALILRRPILLLDDCLSNVDTHTEEAILQGFRAVMEDRSVVLISHRISTVKNADRIVVLENGEIAEMGRHEELAIGGGLYERIHRRQLLEESLGIRS